MTVKKLRDVLDELISRKIETIPLTSVEGTKITHEWLKGSWQNGKVCNGIDAVQLIW